MPHMAIQSEYSRDSSSLQIKINGSAKALAKAFAKIAWPKTAYGHYLEYGLCTSSGGCQSKEYVPPRKCWGIYEGAFKPWAEIRWQVTLFTDRLLHICQQCECRLYSPGKVGLAIEWSNFRWWGEVVAETSQSTYYWLAPHLPSFLTAAFAW